MIDNIKFNKIKKNALEAHIPIIMDDTLEVIEKALKRKKYRKYIRNRNSSRIFSNMFF